MIEIGQNLADVLRTLIVLLGLLGFVFLFYKAFLS